MIAGNAAHLRDLAIAYHRQGRHREALTALDQAISAMPDWCDAWKLRGQILLGCGAYREALAGFDRALTSQRDDADTISYRGDALRLLGERSEALAAYQQATDLNPDHARALNGMGLIATDQGHAQAALAYHDRVLALDPNFVEAHNGRGLALSRLGDLAAALASFTRALTLWPSYVDALVNAGNTQRRMGRLQEALSHHEKALQIDPDSVDALYSQAGVLGALDRLDQAIEACDRVLLLDPAFMPALMRRATLLGLQGCHEEAVLSFDRVIALPSETDSFYAKAHVLRGNSLRHLNRLTEAVAAYDRAISLRPKFADAWASRGVALRQLGEFHDAIDNYNTALDINPRHLDARNYRCILLATLGRNEAAEADARVILSIDPNNGAAYNSLGNALQRQGRIPEALASFEAAIRLVSNPTAARFNYGMCLLLAGDFANGWREYEVRTQTEGWIFLWDVTHRPLWLGREDIAGRTIMLYAEQGFGDTINFCRYVPMVVAMGARVVLGAPSILRRLMQSLDDTIEVIDDAQTPPPFDMHCSIMSLPLVFGTDLSNIPSRVPYLAPPEEYRLKWQQRLGPRRGPRIGLAWSGNDKPLGRSIPLDVIGPLLAMLPEVFCLQRELRPADVPAVAMYQGIRFFGHELEDFCDTAALMEELDLIISIDTSVLHLAGALGRPTWGMLPYAADWRWLLDREDSPWYPTMRLFRQPASGDWTSVVDRIRNELATHLGSRRAA